MLFSVGTTEVQAGATVGQQSKVSCAKLDKERGKKLQKMNEEYFRTHNVGKSELISKIKATVAAKDTDLDLARMCIPHPDLEFLELFLTSEDCCIQSISFENSKLSSECTLFAQRSAQLF